MSKRILSVGIDANEANLLSNRVGSNQAVFGLLKGLYKINSPCKFSVYLSAPPVADMPEERKNWKYRVIPPPKLWTQWRLPLDLYLNKQKSDVFLSPSHYMPRYSPVPVVVIIADLGYLKFPQYYRRKDYLQLKNWTEYSIKKATHIIAVSQTTKNDLIEFYKISPDRVSVVYHGYDKDVYHQINNKPETDRILKKYGIDSSFILFLGSLRPTKNVERLIEAFNILKDKNIKLVLAGKKGWMYESIFEKVGKLGLEKRVIFTDYVLGEDLPFLLSSAKVFALPSLYEGFGIPVIEAMACGIPTIVSNAGSLPEISGGASVIVDPLDIENISDGLEIAIKKSGLYIKLGFERVKDFNWQKSAKNVVDILEMKTFSLRSFV